MVQSDGLFTTQGLALVSLPLIERSAVAEGEPSHELTAVELCGLGEENAAFRTDFVVGMAVGTALSQQVAVADYIDGTTVCAVQRHYASINDQPCAAHAFSESGQRSAQRVLGV
jgi:hypothetical protein